MVGLTDMGRVRSRNEDAIAWDSDIGFAVIADGLGGHNAGQVASAMAVDSIQTELRRALTGAAKDLEGGDARAEHAFLVNASVRKANQDILEAAQTRPQYAGMGTTIVLALFTRDFVTIAHVGDSRLYRLRDDRLDQLTVDHSLVQELMRHGHMTEQDARLSGHRNIITRALGLDPRVRIDVGQHPVQSRDVYLLCSDGLTNLVSDLEIHLQLGESASSLRQAATELVQMANGKGGHDNISLVLVHVE
jgi:PPM family protein phosphatase